jgi:hypothetical protein
MLRRLPLIVALAAALVAGTGCNKQSVVTEGATEGVWLNVGGLQYHVQGSRILNPSLTPDSSYLTGLPVGILPPGPNELWFAVFLRVENRTSKTYLTAHQFEIVDTQGNKFTPLALNSKVNPFAYRSGPLAGHGILPAPDSPADFDSANGAELLFKLNEQDYQNRPLQLVIHSQDVAPQRAALDLDV